MSEDYSSVDRLGADVGPEYFRCVTWETTERALSGTTVYLRAERSHWRDKVTSVCLTPKNGNISVP